MLFCLTYNMVHEIKKCVECGNNFSERVKTDFTTCFSCDTKKYSDGCKELGI